MDVSFKEALQKVKEAIVLSEFISQSLQLQQRGELYFAKCPFHEENTASFVINDAKRYYRCFGCGTTGDVFIFIQKSQGVSLTVALQAAAIYAEIELKMLKNDEINLYPRMPIVNTYDYFLEGVMKQSPYIFDDPRAKPSLPVFCSTTVIPKKESELASCLTELIEWFKGDCWKTYQNHTAYIFTLIASEKFKQLLCALAITAGDNKYNTLELYYRCRLILNEVDCMLRERPDLEQYPSIT